MSFKDKLKKLARGESVDLLSFETKKEGSTDTPAPSAGPVPEPGEKKFGPKCPYSDTKTYWVEAEGKYYCPKCEKYHKGFHVKKTITLFGGK